MKTLHRLWPYLKKQRGRIVLAFLCAIVSVSAKIAIPFLTGKAIDQIRAGNLDISVYLFVMAGCLVIGSLFRYLFDLATAYVAQRVVKSMRDDVFRSLNEVPVSYIDRHSHGDLLLRLVGDIETVQTGLITGAGALFEGAVQILVTLGFMFALHWLLGLVVVLLTPLSVLVSRTISRKNSVYFKKQSADLGQLSSLTLQTLNNAESVVAYGMHQNRKELFETQNQAYRSSSFKALFAASWINPATRLVNNTIYGAVIALGASVLLFPDAFSFTGVAFSVGALSAFLSYSYQYMTPFNEIADAMSEVFYASAALQRVYEAINEPKDINEGNVPLGKEVEDLKAKDIVFSYDGKKTIIQDFTLDVYKGHKIAFVGPTGCGKTTLINLLMRFYDPQQGGFYFNGVQGQDIQKRELRSHVGMVLQDTWLKHASIRDNIAYARPDASMDEIVEAAKKAHADEFIRRLPQGYDTIVSASSGLSMGEKQLLCVARIMVLRPEIVILDEATSNIDLRTEMMLADAFDELMKGKTSLVVAHRLSTIRNADHIIVLDQGKIVEEGNFRQLMEKGGFFAELYHAQLA
ncbi:MAG: ABC transporter ATP-binding protein/permease [Bacilli bacterium]|nr:ABC transporter ATP-binding protein/permease [Bacilli bacterium]